MSKLTSIGHLGSFYGNVVAGADMCAQFKADMAIEHPTMEWMGIRKIAIETTPGTVIAINGIDIVVPSTGIIELGFDFVIIETLVFQSAVAANIVYFW